VFMIVFEASLFLWFHQICKRKLDFHPGSNPELKKSFSSF